MHRALAFTVPPEKSAAFEQQLAELAEVVSLSVTRGGSLKPAGHDVLTVHVLNRGADEVLRRARAVLGAEGVSAVSSEVTSLIMPGQHTTVLSDKDEALWEEMQSGLHHQARIGSNYLLLMALGGAIATVGLVAEPVPQAVAFVASAIIAPGFDPMTKVALGLVLRNWGFVGRGLRSALAGYAALVAAAALTMAALVAHGDASAAKLRANPEVQHLVQPGLAELLPAAAGALAGLVMLAAFRRSFQAGPLIAMAFIPAAALVGAGLAVGQADLAVEGLARFGADWGFILALGLPFLWLKQWLVHRRRPLV